MKFWEGSLDLGELGLCFYVGLFCFFPFQVERSCLREGSRAFFRMSRSEGSDIDENEKNMSRHIGLFSLSQLILIYIDSINGRLIASRPMYFRTGSVYRLTRSLSKFISIFIIFYMINTQLLNGSKLQHDIASSRYDTDLEYETHTYMCAPCCAECRASPTPLVPGLFGYHTIDALLGNFGGFGDWNPDIAGIHQGFWGRTWGLQKHFQHEKQKRFT